MKTRFLCESASPWVSVVLAMCFALPVCGAGGLEFSRDSVCEAGETFDDAVVLRNSTDVEVVFDTVGVILDTASIRHCEIWFSTVGEERTRNVLEADGAYSTCWLSGQSIRIAPHDSMEFCAFHYGSCLSCVGSQVWAPGSEPCETVDSEVLLVFRAGIAVDTLVVRGVYETTGTQSVDARSLSDARHGNRIESRGPVRMDGRVLRDRQPRPYEKAVVHRCP